MTFARPASSAALVAGGALLVLVALPVAAVLVGGVVTTGRDGRLVAVLTDPVTVRAMENSVVQGTAAAAGAVAIGAPAGMALGRYRFPGRDLLSGILLVPFLLPSLTMVVALVALLGPTGTLGAPLPAVRPWSEGLRGVVLADVLYNAPIVALLTSVGVESSSPALEESARTLGATEGRIFREIWGPGAFRGAGAGAALTFALSAFAFAAPLALGGPSNYTLEARIWSLDLQLADLPAAAAVAALGLVVLAPATGAALLLLGPLRRRAFEAGRTARSLTRGDRIGLVLMASLGALLLLETAVLAVVVGAIGAPGSRALGGGSALAQLASSGAAGRMGLPLSGAVGNSLLFAGMAAVLVLLLGLGLASARTGRGARSAESIPLAILLVSPVILALGLAESLRPFTGLDGTWALIVLSQAVLALPFVAQALRAALHRVPTGLGETARLLGSSPVAAFLEVELPAARAGVIAAGLMAAALCLGEFTATYFLAIPRFTTLTVALYRLSEARLLPEASALAGVFVLMAGAILAASAVGGRRVPL